MRRLWTAVTAMTLGATFSYGCDDEPTPADKLVESLDEYEVIRNEQIDIICDCSKELGYMDVAGCKTGQGEILPARRQCLDDAFLQDEAASQQYLDCILPLQRNYRDCIDSKLACDNLATEMPCVEDRDLGVSKCINLPQTVQRDIDACF